jgi:glycosyltransferase involved in cell wall biosynthesis
VVVGEEERTDFERAVAVTSGISAGPLEGGVRAFDFGFWGRFPYFANADAVAWLLDEIWPAIRALHPASTLVLGGADASPSLRRAARDAGATLVSPVEKIASFARNIRVALMPLRYGSGESTKVLEAAEAGCAVVGTPVALRGLWPLAPHSRIESTAAALARAAVDLLDEGRRAPLVGSLRNAVERHYARSATLDRLSAIAAGAEGA